VSDCIFCRVVAGTAPALVVAEDELTVAFLDTRPACRGHTLVVPRAHVEHLWDCDGETAAAVMRSAHAVAGLIRRQLRPDGLTMRQNTGQASGQVVPHLHFHLVPRWLGDGHIGWPTPPVAEVDLREVLGSLRP
jgi:histidine triad (HIT) family protein